MWCRGSLLLAVFLIEAAAGVDLCQGVVALGAEKPKSESDAAKEPKKASKPSAGENKSAFQVSFAGPAEMRVRWDTTGRATFDAVPLIVPGVRNFPWPGVYRLKLTHIPGRAGLELYPSVEIGAVTPRSLAFLSHNTIPIKFTAEDFDRVTTGNFITKVIYLTGGGQVSTVVGSHFAAGADPIGAADRRGTILAIVRLGNRIPVGLLREGGGLPAKRPVPGINRTK